MNIDQGIDLIGLPSLMGTAPMMFLAMRFDSVAHGHFWTSSSSSHLRFSDVVQLSLLSRHEIALERPKMSLPVAQDLQGVSLSSCLAFVNIVHQAC